MINIKELDFNRTYVIDDIISTNENELNKYKTFFNISKYIIPDNKCYFSTNEEKIHMFFCQIIENKQPNLYIFPIECIKICELIFHLKKIINEKTQNKLFPFCFYIRKNKDGIIFIPLNKYIRQLLFGIYGILYKKEKIKKGLLYGFKCTPKTLNIYNFNIPSEKFLNILKNIDNEMNKSLSYNCLVCYKDLQKYNQCKHCEWAIYCSDKCYKNDKFKNHISDKVFKERMKYYNELKNI